MTASHAGQRVDLGPRRQRFVLAVLALNVNQALSVDRLIELAWSGAAPGRPRTRSRCACPGCVRRSPSRLRSTRQGGAGAPTSLAVEASFDDGKTWRPVRVDGNKVQVRHPDGHGYVSLKAAAADRNGNAVEETVLRAYRY